MSERPIIPLIIDGADATAKNNDRLFKTNSFGGLPGSKRGLIQGADTELCCRVLASSAKAFSTWRQTDHTTKRKLFQRLGQILRERGGEVQAIIEEEINCSRLWSHINLEDTIGMVEELAALVTSSVLDGIIPPTKDPNSHTMILTEPLGVVLGIAPWNSPLILGMRAVAAPIAAGNTAILKGSEFSPRTHYFVARIFQEAGFPPGVLNFVLHRPEDAAQIFDQLITFPDVRKCNFTGSTAVGRSIASRAAAALTPVLLELGGKNFEIVLEDADLDKAVQCTLEGAFLNNGQICMSTDIVLVARSALESFSTKLRSALQDPGLEISTVVSQKSKNRLQSLIDDALRKGASISASLNKRDGVIPATVIEGLTAAMDFYSEEAFGPLLGILPFDEDSEALDIVNNCQYGLSAAIFTNKHLRALKMARGMRVGAIHINASTVHDEPTLPHGGHGNSGWGRFGGTWGIREFVHTKTIIVNE